MDYQSWIESFDGQASLYSFDILEDGSYSEIRLMAVNKMSEGMLHMNPNAPEFYPGIPYRNFWMDLNFENFIYKAAAESQPLYSYVNARGVWLKGFYLPVADIWDDDQIKNKAEGSRTVYCLYIISFSEQVETEAMNKRSPEVSKAVLDIGIKLHETPDFYQSLASSAKQIREFCEAKLCSIYVVDKNKQECCYINENGVQDQFIKDFAAGMGRTPYEVAEAWEKDLALSDCLLLEDLSIIKERDPSWYKSMSDYGVQNIVLFAIRYNQKIVGYIWVANYDYKKMEQIKETLELSTFLLAAVIENHQLMSQLEVKSTIDALTQVGNRSAMDGYIEELENSDSNRPESVGVVFADLNGLKKVNDEKGHDAGDSLLIRASSLLKIVFSDNQIYRVGGDEFVILCANTSEERIKDQITQLKGMAEKTNDVSFAVGSSFCTGSYDINNAIQEADERMYTDKKEYYAIHPEMDRRKNR